MSDGDALLIIELQAKQKAFQKSKSQVAVDNHFADVMVDYYAKRLKQLLLQKGETVTFEAVRTP